MGQEAGGKVARYEATGGFLLGFDAQLRGPLAALATRDSLLLLIAILVAVRTVGGVAKRGAQELALLAAPDRIENVLTEVAQAFALTPAASDAAGHARLPGSCW
jgi:phosphomannomutase